MNPWLDNRNDERIMKHLLGWSIDGIWMFNDNKRVDR